MADLLKRLEEQDQLGGTSPTTEGGVEGSLDLPLDPEPRKVKPPVAPKIHVVQKGENLWAISRQYYNTPAKWTIIWEANKHLIGATPEDLQPDMRLVIPPLEEAKRLVPHSADTGASEVVWAGKTPPLSAEGASGTKHYDVQAGDTLWKIAEKFYGDGTAWEKILKANPDVLDDPQDLRENMRLVLP